MSAYVAPSLDASAALMAPTMAFGSFAGVAWLTGNSGDAPFLHAPAEAAVTDWRLNRPDQRAVRGYFGDVSAVPGGELDLHLAGRDSKARVDIFRIGRQDAHHVETLHDVPVVAATDAGAVPTTGRIEDSWPTSIVLKIGDGWQPGVYLAKLTGASGGQSYVPFVVRNPRPAPFTVVIPLLTYQAYNDEGGASLYRWDGGAHARAYEVSFDRPFRGEYGAGQLFLFDFPLIVWLENHGYQPAYTTDLDLARNPILVEGVSTLLFSGHSEYWTGGLRDAVGTAARRGTNLAFFGANDAFWQIRLGPDEAGLGDRTVICYKDGTLDPEAAHPAQATVAFADPAIARPFSELSGAQYGGIVRSSAPLVLTSLAGQFAPGDPAFPGARFDAVVGGEVDTAAPAFQGLILASTPVAVGVGQVPLMADATLYVNAEGGHVFDAGTLGWSWGLDWRYAAGAPAFQGEAFARLTARILAWTDAQPLPDFTVPPPLPTVVPASAKHAPGLRVVAIAVADAAAGHAVIARLIRAGIRGFLLGQKTVNAGTRWQVTHRPVSTVRAGALVARLARLGIHATTTLDRGPGS